MLNYFINILYINKTALCAFLLALLILVRVIVESISPKRVKVKRRVIQKNSKMVTFIEKTMSKAPILNQMKEHIRVQLGLVTSKSNSKNEYYANITVFFLISFAIIEAVIIAFTRIPAIFKPLLAILGLVIPYLIINLFIKSRRKKIYNDFPQLVSIYVSKYQITKNTKEALRKSIPDLPNTLRHEIKRLTNVMNASDSYDKALDEFDARVDYLMCTAFVAILKTGYKTNGDIIDSLMELESYIAQERLDEKKKEEQLKDKKWNLYFFIAAMPLAYYVIVSKFQDKAINFYWHTMQGQAVMAGCFIFSIIAIVLIIIEDSL